MVFVTDVFSRRIIGWQTTYRPVCTDLALDALEMAVWQRKRQGADLSDLVHHLRPRRVSTGPSAMGQALSECEAVASVGSKGDSFRLCSGRGSELLVQGRADPQPEGPWEDIDAVEVATAEWVHWAGTIRSHSAIGMRTPAEHEATWAPDRHRHERSQPATTGTR